MDRDALVEKIRAELAKHIRVDATGLAPAVASAFVVGLAEAARAALAVAEPELEAAWNRRAPSAAYRAGAEAMREKAADKADAMADSWDADWRAERKASTHLEGKSDGAVEIAAAIRDLPLPEAPEETRDEA